MRFALARAFVHFNARPLDRALFAFYFESGSSQAVLAELAKYQNADGGFGHGMEPDFRLGASSPMATSVGLQYAAAVGAEASHPLVAGAVGYLLSALDRKNVYWPCTSLAVNDEPHAPWWHKTAMTPPNVEEWPNPSAELLGYLYRWRDGVEQGVLEMLTTRALRVLEADPGPHPAYNILCWQRALPYLPPTLQEAVWRYLQAAVRVLLPLRQEELMEVRVCWLAPTPDSPVAQMVGPEIRPLIEAEVEKQGPDGGWWPTWEWSQYPEVWAVAKREWAGKMTVEILHALRS